MDLEDWKAHLSTAVLQIRLNFILNHGCVSILDYETRRIVSNDVNRKGRSKGRHDVHKQQTGRYRQQLLG